MTRCASCRKPIEPGQVVCPQCGHPQTRVPLPPGSGLDGRRYSVGQVLAQTPKGLLYRGADTANKKPVWVFELFPPALRRVDGGHLEAPPHLHRPWQGFLRQATREARQLARVNHPGVAQVIRLLEEQYTLYLVYPALEGEPLAQRLRRGTLTGTEATELARKLAEALVPLHGAGLGHGSLTPATIWLTPDNRVVISGYDLATQHPAARQLTAGAISTGLTAPELRRGRPRLLLQSDVYALAAVVVLAFSGSLPPRERRFSGPALEKVLANMPPGLAQAVRTSLHPAAPQRFMDAADFLHGLYQLPREKEPGMRLSRRSLLLAGGALAGTGLLGLSSWLIWQGLTSRRAPALELVSSLTLPGPITRLKVDASGKWATAAVQRPDGVFEAALINLATNTSLPLTGSTAAIRDLAIAQNTVLAVGEDRSILLWDLNTGRPMGSLRRHTGAVTSLAVLTGTTRSFVTGSADGTLLLWRAGSRQPALTLEVGSPVTSLALSPDGRWLVSGHQNGSLEVWDTSNWTPARRVLAHAAPARLPGIAAGVTCLAYSPRGDLLASGGLAGQVILWKTTDWTEQNKFEAPELQVASLAFSPGGDSLAVSSNLPEALIYRVGKPEIIGRLPDHGGWVTEVAFLPNAKLLVTASLDGQVRLWNF